MGTWLRKLKLQMIDTALMEHRAILGAVEALGDKPLIELYDVVLGVLSGPRTLRLRKNPSLAGALRLRGAQRSFARAFYHQRKLMELGI